MGGKRRQKIKAQRDELAAFSLGNSARRTTGHAYANSEISDSESCTTHVTLDDDSNSVVSDFVDYDEDLAADDEAPFSDKLNDSLDRISHKTISIRASALNDLIALLVKNYAPAHLEKFKETIIDVIEKALKKSDDEASNAALLAALMSIQLADGIGDEMEPALSTMCQLCMDASRAVGLRVQCARAITIFCMIAAVQPSSIAQSADALRSIWIGTKSNALSSSLFSATLFGWSLLISQAGSETLKAALLDEAKLCTYVDGTQVEMRLSAGEALTVIHETAVTAFGDTYRFPNEDHLLNMIATLSNDSLKFRGKKDKRIQRLTFRQIHSAIKDRQAPSIAIKFGTETLFIDSCAKKMFYEFLCRILHTGLNTHLRMNPVIRDWLDLGPVMEQCSTKMAKSQRIAIQNAISKTRDLKRSKQRDKRTAY